jgi:hypothetical protein
MVQKFLDHSSFTDYKKASTNAFLDYVPHDLLIQEHEFFYLPTGWKPLFDSLTNKIESKIKLSTTVKEITHCANIKWKIQVQNSKDQISSINAETVFITHSDLFPLMKDFEKNELPEIFTIPFLKIYTFHTEIPVKSPQVVSSELKKIIPINDHILLSSYSDSDDTCKFYKELVEQKGNEKLFIQEKLSQHFDIKEKNTVKDVFIKFWDNGTHAFKPGAKNLDRQYWKSSKFSGIFGIGEAFSRSQGWIEGALESVENWLKYEYAPNKSL